MQHLATAIAHFVGHRLQARVVLRAEDAGVVGVVDQRGVEFGGKIARGFDEFLFLGLRNQHVIRCHAGLPGVGELGVGDLAGGRGDIVIVAHQRR